MYFWLSPVCSTTMSRIFQDRSLPQSGTGLQVDSKLRQKDSGKKRSLWGHRPDDHEDPELNQSGMGGMTGVLIWLEDGITF